MLLFTGSRLLEIRLPCSPRLNQRIPPFKSWERYGHILFAIACCCREYVLNRQTHSSPGQTNGFAFENIRRGKMLGVLHAVPLDGSRLFLRESVSRRPCSSTESDAGDRIQSDRA